MPVLFTISTIKGSVFSSDYPDAVFSFPDDIPVGIALGGEDSQIIDHWRPFVKKFLCSSHITRADDFNDYVRGFLAYVSDEGLCSSSDPIEILIQGYGETSMFPSVSLLRGMSWPDSVSLPSLHPYDRGSEYHVIGKGEEVLTLLQGIVPDSGEIYAKEFAKQARKMKKRLVSTMETACSAAGVRYARRINVNDQVEVFKDRLTNMIQMNHESDFNIAIESFNMDDLIAMSENLVNLSMLRDSILKREALHASTKEIAIITRAEGFVWIKK